MKVYIAGKITGDPDYKAKFARAEKWLAEQGHSVMNPAWIEEYPNFTYKDYTDAADAMLKTCEAALFLEDWQDSFGAKRERILASRLGLRIYDQTPDGWKEGDSVPLPQRRGRKGK